MTYRLKAPDIIDANMAIVEHLYTKHGPDGFAKLIAEALLAPMPPRQILDAVVRLLDPCPGDNLRLVVERRSRGNTKMRQTKRREDIDIALDVLNFQIEPGNSSRKKAVGEIATARSISKSKVEKALRVLSLIPK